MCEAKLRSGTDGMRCPKCEYVEGSTDKPSAVQSDSAKEDVETTESAEGLNVLDPAEEGGDGVSTLPTIKIDCEKCGNDEAVWWMLQTRSADEPTTQFYRCTKCKYTWRDYS